MIVVPIDHLVPTPDNRRKPITDTSVRSLAQSIKHEGLLQPIVVREHPTETDRFEIRAGERRWRAAKLAGLSDVPIVVRKLDNEQALAVTIAENLLRQDLHPLEEAEAIQLAFEREYDLKTISGRLGRSIAYLARRASLCQLSKRWRAAVMKRDTEASRLSAVHLELIARLPESTQDALAEGDFWPVFGRGFPTVNDLRRVIDGALRSLASMPWNPTDETLDPKAGACVNCPKRSSRHPMLFPEDDSTGNGRSSKYDRCLDPECFYRKQVAFVQRCECKHRTTHPHLRLVHIGAGPLSPAVQEAFADRVERMYAPRLVKSGHPNAVSVMQVDGPKAGKVVYVSMGDSVSANSNGRTSRPRGAGGNVVPMTLAEKRTRLQKRRDAYVVKHVQEFLRNLAPVKATEIVALWIQRRINGEVGANTFDPVALLAAFGINKRADYVDGGEAWNEYDSLRGSEPMHQAASALLAVAQVWIKRLNIQGGHTVTAQAEDARRMCQILGINFSDLAAEARRAIPQPKSWASGDEPDPPPVSAEPIEDNEPQEVDEPPFDADPSSDEVEIGAVASEVG